MFQVGPIAQGRQAHREAVQPVVQVFAEQPGADQIPQAPVGGTDHVDVDRVAATAAQRRHGTILQHAQQAGLQVDRHVTDFVEKQRATIGIPNPARRSAPPRPRERTFLVPEQFRLNQRVGNGRAVHSNKRTRPPGAVLVQRTRQPFLARAGFSFDQQRNARLHDLARPVDRFAHAGVVATDLLRCRLQRRALQCEPAGLSRRVDRGKRLVCPSITVCGDRPEDRPARGGGRRRRGRERCAVACHRGRLQRAERRCQRQRKGDRRTAWQCAGQHGPAAES